ncbi:MAG: thiol oxidoreductase [Myxococcales bacterium]|nr:thiol oxidoreductase [Myxococcales bacterium]
MPSSLERVLRLSAASIFTVGLVGCSTDGPGAAMDEQDAANTTDAVDGLPVDDQQGTEGSAAPSSRPPAAGGAAGSDGSTQPPSSDASPPGELAGDVVPLYDASTVLEPEVHFDRGDAIVTRFGDRGRDRHAREDQFQSYDHYLPHYWEHRTARIMFVDRVAKGGSNIDVSFVTEWKLGPAEFRAWYHGMGTVAHYSGNYAPLFVEEGPGTYDEDHERIGDGGTQYKYSYTIESAIELDGSHAPLQVGQFMEIEVSQFLDAPPVGRDNYYGTVFLYEVGVGGVVPWQAVGDFDDKASERENSRKLDERAWTAGRTTLPYQYSDEPDNHFMQMATNLSGRNAQPFVRGRRVHHTDMVDGSHDEGAENGTFDALQGLAGPRYINRSCDGCHTRNGRAPVAPEGELLDRWVFKVGAADGGPTARYGAVLQPQATDGGSAEPGVWIERWVEQADGLRAPVYAFGDEAPARHSARLAPQLVGMGLLEAIPEEAVLAHADPEDANGDGISGRAQRSIDPVTGEMRLGRFGWKAGAGSLRHQIANALNTDMGVMTSVRPSPDCGAMQDGCAEDTGAELDDAHLDDLVRYVALLGVRARRDIDDPQTLQGEAVFAELGCSGCHLEELTTSPFHPYAELRGQVIHPYTDLLLHDMGEGLADDLGEGEASGAEWRTTPLWGLGLSACVTGGVEGPFQSQVCTPDESYLHDGRARTLDEAILWHGGEGQASREAYVAATEEDRAALLAFLRSL